MENKFAEYKPEEIYNMRGIVLEKENSAVKTNVSLFLKEISRKGNAVTLTGVKTLSGAEPISISANLRSCLWLHTKSANRQNPFSRAEMEKFFGSNEMVLKSKYAFYVKAICESSTGIAFSLTWKPLVYLNERIFIQYMKGEIPKKVPEVAPFVMGNTEVEIKQGTAKVLFGLYNGNSGVSVVNPKKALFKIASGKHLTNSIVHIRNVLLSSALMNAETGKEAAEIYGTFKSAIM